MTTGEGDCSDLGVLDNGFDEGEVAGVEELGDAMGKTGLGEEGDDVFGDGGGLGRGFENDGVTGEEGGDEGVDEDEVGVVPGEDDEDDADGCFADEALEAVFGDTRDIG